jgi:hypothetical protein
MPAPTIIQDSGVVITNGTVATPTISLTGVVAGNAIIACGSPYTGNGLSVTDVNVTDNQTGGGTNYTQDALVNAGDGSGSQASKAVIARRMNVPTPTGSWTCSFAASGGVGNPYFFGVIYEVSGIRSDDPVDEGGGDAESLWDLDTDVQLAGGTLADATSLAFAGLNLSVGDNPAVTGNPANWSVDAESYNGSNSNVGAFASRTTTTTTALTANWSHANYVGDTVGRGAGFIVVYKGAPSGLLPRFAPTLYHLLHNPR